MLEPAAIRPDLQADSLLPKAVWDKFKSMQGVRIAGPSWWIVGDVARDVSSVYFTHSAVPGAQFALFFVRALRLPPGTPDFRLRLYVYGTGLIVEEHLESPDAIRYFENALNEYVASESRVWPRFKAWVRRQRDKVMPW